MLRLVLDHSWPESWKMSHFYDELEIGDSRRNPGYRFQYQIRHEWVLRAIEELIPVGGAVLDVAGASGNFSLPLAEKGYHIVWNDLRADLAEMVRRKYEFGEIEFSPGNIFNFANEWAGRFDAVLAAEIIEHMAHPDQLLVCLAGMLRPGGRLFLTTPNGRYFRSHKPRFSDCPDPSAFESDQFKPNADGHIFLLDCDECRSLGASAGLAVERIVLASNPLSCGHVKLGYLLPYLPVRLVRALESETRKLPQVLKERLNTQILAVLRKLQK